MPRGVLLFNISDRWLLLICDAKKWLPMANHGNARAMLVMFAQSIVRAGHDGG